MKKKTIIAILAGIIMIASGLTVALVATAQEDYTWSFVTIPDLPSGATLGRLWTDRPGNLYVWAQTNEPGAILYHWDGRSWSQVLCLPALSPGYVFGTGSLDVFASAYGGVNGIPKMYHFDGTTWTEQLLPANLVGAQSRIVGEADNIYFWVSGVSSPRTIRYDGTIWQTVTTPGVAYIPVYISKDEIYVIGCWGHSLWNGNNWNWFPGFDFCDVSDAWGMRDKNGILHLYATGSNNFGNGVKVWKYIETYPGSMTGSWGSKYGTVFSDPPGYGYRWAGQGYGIWGSGPNDIYVIGSRPAWSSGPSDGRVYHYNGTDWERITVFGDIFTPGYLGVWGTGSNDVWITTGDRLLHYGPINQPPVADAGPEQRVSANSDCQGEVTLNGTGSTDPDNDTLAYTWSGPFGTATGATPTVKYLALGTHTITLTVDDGKGGTATDTVDVTVYDGTPPVPDAAVLPKLAGECSVEISEIPTATDNCAGRIAGTTTDPLRYTAQGNYTVTWTYNDGHGNTEFQTQTVIVRDTTPPVPDVAILPTNSDQCSIEITTIPTATDICDGKIIGTTNDPVQYPNQGAYTIHWTYTDRAGNVSTQNQSIIVKDTIAPTINVSAPECVTYGNGNGNKANKITVTAQDNCSKSVIPQITKVEVFNNGGNLVTGNGIYEISGNTVYVNPNGNGWSVRITVIAADENGNTQTIQITKSLIKC